MTPKDKNKKDIVGKAHEAQKPLLAELFTHGVMSEDGIILDMVSPKKPDKSKDVTKEE